MLAETLPPTVTQAESAPPVPARLRVLVVDDNQDAADSTAELLTVCGADVTVRYGGEAALAAVAEAMPDAVLLDLSMPVMDGCEVATLIRHTVGGAGPLLVALTALGDEATRARVAASGFNLHFTKPVDPTELLSVLGEHRARIRNASTP